MELPKIEVWRYISKLQVLGRFHKERYRSITDNIRQMLINLLWPTMQDGNANKLNVALQQY